MVVIREVGEGEAEVMTELICLAYSDVAEQFGLSAETCPSHPAFTTVDDQRRAMAKGVRYFLLGDDDGPAGCVALDSRKREEAWLARLSVLPEKRRQGYGRALVEHVVSKAREQSLPAIHIGVIAEHDDLVRWYEQLGFERGERRQYEHLPFEVLLMVLRNPQGV